MADRSTQPLETAIDKGFYKFTEGLQQADVEAIISTLKGKQENNKKDRLILATLETDTQKRAYQDWKKLVSLERVKDILGRDFIHNDDLVRLLNKLKDPSTRRAFTQWCEEALGGQGSWPEDYIFDEARSLLSRKSSTEPTEEKFPTKADGLVVVPPQTTTQYSTAVVEKDLTKRPSTRQEEEAQKAPQLLSKKNEGKPITEDFAKLRKIADTLSFHQATFSKTTVACIKECEGIFAQMNDTTYRLFPTSSPFPTVLPYKNTLIGDTQGNNENHRLLYANKLRQQEELKQERWQILDLCAEIRIHIKYKSPIMPVDNFRVFLVRLIEDAESRQGQGGLFPEIVKDLQSVLEYYDRKVMEVGDAVQKKARTILTECEIEGKLLDLRRLKHYGEVVDKAIVKEGIAVPPTR